MNICLPDASLNSCPAHYITANFNYLPVNVDGYNLLYLNRGQNAVPQNWWYCNLITMSQVTLLRSNKP